MKNPYQDEETFLHGSSLEPNVPRVRRDHKEIDKARQSSQCGYDFWPEGHFFHGFGAVHDREGEHGVGDVDHES